jgi:hypothetical protein
VCSCVLSHGTEHADAAPAAIANAIANATVKLLATDDAKVVVNATRHAVTPDI